LPEAVFFFRKYPDEAAAPEEIKSKWLWGIGLPIGAVLGGLAGLLGIGGGIYLSPILHFLKWGHAKQIAAASSFFILVNSLVGLMGHLSKQTNFSFLGQYACLLVAVFFGSRIGSVLTTEKFSGRFVVKVTSILIIFVGLRTLLKVL